MDVSQIEVLKDIMEVSNSVGGCRQGNVNVVRAKILFDVFVVGLRELLLFVEIFCQFFAVSAQIKWVIRPVVDFWMIIGVHQQNLGEFCFSKRRLVRLDKIQKSQEEAGQQDQWPFPASQKIGHTKPFGWFISINGNGSLGPEWFVRWRIGLLHYRLHMPQLCLLVGMHLAALSKLFVALQHNAIQTSQYVSESLLQPPTLVVWWCNITHDEERRCRKNQPMGQQIRCLCRNAIGHLSKCWLKTSRTQNRFKEGNCHWIFSELLRLTLLGGFSLRDQKKWRWQWSQYLCVYCSWKRRFYNYSGRYFRRE